MNNVRCVDLYSLNTNNQVTITSFCFERTALNFARESGLTSFVIALRGRVLHSEGVNPTNFMRAA